MLIIHNLATHMRREQGGTSLPLDGPSRVGGAARHHHRAISPAFELLHCESPSPVFDLSGGSDLSGGEAGSSKEGGDGQDGEADEGGEGSAVDGLGGQKGVVATCWHRKIVNGSEYY